MQHFYFCFFYLICLSPEFLSSCFGLSRQLGSFAGHLRNMFLSISGVLQQEMEVTCFYFCSNAFVTLHLMFVLFHRKCTDICRKPPLYVVVDFYVLVQSSNWRYYYLFELQSKMSHHTIFGRVSILRWISLKNKDNLESSLLDFDWV